MGAKRGPKHLEGRVILEIRFLYQTDEYTQKDLAAKYNLSQSTICKIVNNYIHKNVPMISVGGTAGARVKARYSYGD